MIDGPEHDARPEPSAGGSSRVWVGQGALRVEARLLAEVRAWHEATRADPARLAHPLVVLVPSRSLKDHVSATLVRELGTLAGVAVQTHYGLALQVLERAGQRAPAGAELVPVLVRQAAREVPALRVDLDDLDDGYGSVVAAVSDLLDAGLDEATAEPLLEQLAEERGRIWERAAGVVRVALAVRGALAAHGLGRLADVLVRAREAIEADPSRFAPGRVVVHGFADATGLVADFLAALVRAHPSLVLLDRAPDPADPVVPDLGAGFVDPLERVLATAAGGAVERGAEAPPERTLEFFRSPGSDAEVRAVARGIERRLAAGAGPEAIGVVTRTPALYAPALRVQLARLGIPASGAAAAGPRSVPGRRIAFLLDLLRERERMPADRFVLSLRDLHPGQRADLALGLHALGVPRLGDLAAPGVDAAFGEAASFPLPVRRGLTTGEDGDGDDGTPRHDAAGTDTEDAAGTDADDAAATDAADADAAGRGPGPGDAGAGARPRAQRRRLGRGLLLRASARARDVLAAWESSAEPRALGERLEAVEALLADGLGWRRDGEAAPLYARLATLRAELPAALAVTVEEVALLLERSLGRLTHEPLGGTGGGVQLLDVIEARARTFDHLFVLGLNRDHFPRVVAEDPLLPDEVRARIRDVLPELASKERGHEEERFLFAELVSASPDVTISWQILGDDGKAKAPSPLVDRMRSPLDETGRVSTLLAPPDAGVRPAHEWALLAALHGGDAAALLPAALAEAGGNAGVVGEPEHGLAALRAAAVAELDAFGAGEPSDAELGPFFGHVGAARERADLRRGDLWVTTLEKIARCPWQGFLSQMLRLERPPDALEALPEADGLLTGSLVHDVLERIVRDVVPEASEGKLAETLPRPVPWPDDAQLERFLREQAEALLFRNGIGLPGFASVLIEVARPYLEVARQLDWAAGPVSVVGAEVPHAVELATEAGPLRLHFRADRVDRTEAGLVLTDYKAGKPIADARGEGTRLAALLAAIRQGRALQAPAYARVAPGARGGYLYLKPQVSDDSRRFVVGGSDDDGSDEAFERAVGDVAGALAAGTFPPRLVDADGEEPAACEWCELTVACLRGDSGARRRLGAWAASAPPAAGDDPRRRALRAVYGMGDAS